MPVLSKLTVNDPSDDAMSMQSLFPRRVPSPSEPIYNAFCLGKVNSLKILLPVMVV